MKRSRPLSPNVPSRYPPGLDFVLNLSPSAMTLGLGNIGRLLSKLGDPHKTFKSIIVAGTNGKGTVTSCLASILGSSGCFTGRYISPHVYSPTERISLGGKEVSLEEMEQAAGRVVELYDAVNYSYFEALTAMAFLIFARAGVEYAVLETGLGGRFDAANIVEPVLCVLTNIALDHRRILGDTAEEILREKLGITRRGIPLIYGDFSSGLEELIMEKSERDDFPCISAAVSGSASVANISFESMEICIKTGLKDYGSVVFPFPGVHQARNALLAVLAAEKLLGEIDDLRDGFSTAKLPGRFEAFLFGNKRIILDVAHNDAGLLAALDTLSRLSPRSGSGIVLGMLRRKELIEFPSQALSKVKRVYLVEPAAGESLPAEDLLARFSLETLKSNGTDIVVEHTDDCKSFIEKLLHSSVPLENILITGSHRTVEAFGRFVRKEAVI